MNDDGRISLAIERCDDQANRTPVEYDGDCRDDGYLFYRLASKTSSSMLWYFAVDIDDAWRDWPPHSLSLPAAAHFISAGITRHQYASSRDDITQGHCR